jgi:hypothetical protein
LNERSETVNRRVAVHHPIHSVVLVYVVLVAVLSVLLLLLMAWQALVGRLRQIPAHGNPAPSPTDQGTEEGGDQAADTEHRRSEGPDPQVSGPATGWARPKATTSAAPSSAPATRGSSPSYDDQTYQKPDPDVAQRAEGPHQHQDRRSRDQQDEPAPPQVPGRHAVPVPAPSGRCAYAAVTGVSGSRGNGGEEPCPVVRGGTEP